MNERKVAETKLDFEIDDRFDQSLMKQLGYYFTKEGECLTVDTNSKPGRFPTQSDYEQFGKLVQQLVFEILVKHYKFNRKLLLFKVASKQRVKYESKLKNSKSNPDTKLNNNTNNTNNNNSKLEQAYLDHCTLFTTKQYKQKDTLMIIIPGAGTSRPSQWSRTLCISENLAYGTAFPYISYAKKKKWGIMLIDINTSDHFNNFYTIIDIYDKFIASNININIDKNNDIDSNKPTDDNKSDHDDVKSNVAIETKEDNDNSVANEQDKSELEKEKKENMIMNESKDNYNQDNKEEQEFDKNEDKDKEKLNQQQMKKKKEKKKGKNGAIKNLILIAHSLGGFSITKLLNKRGENLENVVKACLFFDCKDPYDPKQHTKNIYKKCAINWIKSELPLNSQDFKEKTKFNGENYFIQRRSAGHKQHEYTCTSCLTSATEYLDSINLD